MVFEMVFEEALKELDHPKRVVNGGVELVSVLHVASLLTLYKVGEERLLKEDYETYRKHFKLVLGYINSVRRGDAGEVCAENYGKALAKTRVMRLGVSWAGDAAEYLRASLDCPNLACWGLHRSLGDFKVLLEWAASSENEEDVLELSGVRVRVRQPGSLHDVEVKILEWALGDLGQSDLGSFHSLEDVLKEAVISFDSYLGEKGITDSQVREYLKTHFKGGFGDLGCVVWLRVSGWLESRAGGVLKSSGWDLSGCMPRDVLGEVLDWARTPWRLRGSLDSRLDKGGGFIRGDG